MNQPINREAHWQRVHQSKRPSEVSWFQPSAATSLDLIEQHCPSVDAKVLDVGGGVSTLVDGLLERGRRSVSVLDVSEEALNHTRQRLGDDAKHVHWIVGDVLVADIGDGYALWHDRAVFHFLTDAADRAQYVDRLYAALQAGGKAVIATFADDGPTMCSGLPIVRYSSEALHEAMGHERFSLVHAKRHVHVTPAGKEQRFQFAVFKRT